MLRLMASNWWVVALRGLVSIIFGIAVLMSPAISLSLLITFFGVYALASGLARGLVAFFNNDGGLNWWLLLDAVVSIGIGITALLWPSLTAMTLLYLIAVQAVGSGIFALIDAYQLREEIEGEWLLALSGVFSIFFGGYLVAQPGEGALTILTILAFYTIFVGITQIFFGFRLRGLGNRIDEVTDAIRTSAEKIRTAR